MQQSTCHALKLPFIDMRALASFVATHQHGGGVLMILPQYEQARGWHDFARQHQPNGFARPRFQISNSSQADPT